uniref:Uncharacterized protein n=1 Tax=Arundo donax TaxID=35708 RepID=A0A0A8Z5B5_ARUDO
MLELIQVIRGTLCFCNVVWTFLMNISKPNSAKSWRIYLAHAYLRFRS